MKDKKKKEIEIIPVFCWQCGKTFEIEACNVYARELFCSDKCRKDNLKRDIEVFGK